MARTLRDMPMMSQREERGYKIIAINGILDGDIYRENPGEPSFLDQFRERLAGSGPLALDLRHCRFSGNHSLGIFTEAYRMFQMKTVAISDDAHLVELLRITRIGVYVDLYRTIEELPAIISSR